MRREEKRGGEKDEDREKRTQRRERDGRKCVEKDREKDTRTERRRTGQRGGEDREGEIRTDGGGGEGKKAG